ncbi:MAG TPA: PIN domain-containing protein [Thermoanaerobaculia bacterium]|nr:PIN domain-containing protein [Thermoanaerobaculia bacterium]
MVELFLDTSYAIALSAPSDQHHDRAVGLAREIESENRRLVTTRAVMVEIGNALAKQRYRAAATALLAAMEEDSGIEIIALSDTLFSRAMLIFRERTDKEWGLTDCVSFVVMQDRHITDALTADTHFRQAGFQPLLLND